MHLFIKPSIFKQTKEKVRIYSTQMVKRIETEWATMPNLSGHHQHIYMHMLFLIKSFKQCC